MSWEAMAKVNSARPPHLEMGGKVRSEAKNATAKITAHDCGLTLKNHALFEPFRATILCGICDGADCWQALNSGFCRSGCRTQADLPPASPDWRVAQVP